MQRRLAVGISALTVAAVAGPATAGWVLPSSGGAATGTGRSLTAPTLTGATAASASSITVSFLPATAQPAGAVTRIVRDTPVAGSTIVCTQDTSPCTDTGLAAGVQYTYTAQTSLGQWVKASASVSATTTGSLSVVTTPPPAATTGNTYSHSLSASGGAAPYTWSVTSGALPTGLSLTSAGVISGTPTTAGTVSFTVRVTDALGQTATAPLTITTAAPAATATQLVISAATNWTAGASQPVTLTARTSSNAVDTSFSGTKNVTWIGTAFAASPSASATAPAHGHLRGGIATFTVTLVRAGAGTLTATTAGLTAAPPSRPTASRSS